MYDFKKLKRCFIVLAFAAPLFIFAATGFGSDDDITVWKPDNSGPSLSVERTAGWQARMQILSRR
jgi:ABC-type spermidine/putrescine transport system permease subunit II